MEDDSGDELIVDDEEGEEEVRCPGGVNRL